MTTNIRSFKLRFWDTHVHVVPRDEVAGVDLRGARAEAAFAIASPIVSVLKELEPDLELRSMSLDLDRPRLLANVYMTGNRGRSRPIRLDAGAALDRVLAAAEPLIEHLAERVEEALARRP